MNMKNKKELRRNKEIKAYFNSISSNVGYIVQGCKRFSDVVGWYVHLNA